MFCQNRFKNVQKFIENLQKCMKIRLRGLKLRQNCSKESPTAQDEHQKWRAPIGVMDFGRKMVAQGGSGGAKIHQKVVEIR